MSKLPSPISNLAIICILASKGNVFAGILISLLYPPLNAMVISSVNLPTFEGAKKKLANQLPPAEAKLAFV